MFLTAFTAVDVSSKTATYTMTVSVVPINNIPKYVPSTGTISIVENQVPVVLLHWSVYKTKRKIERLERE